MVEARIREGAKRFDPYNDPVAQRIAEEVKARVQGQFWMGRTPNHVDMPEVLKAAQPHGYNVFNVYEPAVQGKSIAVTDPSLIEVLKNIPYRDWQAAIKK